jgi:MFS family permease
VLVVEPAERRILFVTNFGHFLSHYNMLVFPALVLPLTKVLDMTMPQVLELSFWQYLLFGVTALPWGIVADRLGGKPLMILMFLGVGLSGIAAGLWTASPGGLTLALAGIGLFSGIYHPIGMGLISKSMSNISMAMGYNAMCGGLGLVAAPLATGFINWMWGPAMAFLVLGAVNLAGVGLMAFCSIGDIAHPHAKDAQTNGGLGAFGILLVAMMLAGVAYTGSSVILTSYLELRSPAVLEFVSSALGKGISGNLLATVATSFVFIIGATGQYVGGRLGQRYDTTYLYLAFHLVCLPAAFAIALASNMALVVSASVYFFFLLGSQPPENTLVARLTPRRLHHSAYGLKFVLTFGVGALAVRAMSWIDATWGLSATFVFLALVSVVLITSVFVLIWWTNRSEVVGLTAEHQGT